MPSERGQGRCFLSGQPIPGAVFSSLGTFSRAGTAGTGPCASASPGLTYLARAWHRVRPHGTTVIRDAGSPSQVLPESHRGLRWRGTGQPQTGSGCVELNFCHSDTLVLSPGAARSMSTT